MWRNMQIFTVGLLSPALSSSGGEGEEIRGHRKESVTQRWK
jgi:hypothetical protein